MKNKQIQVGADWADPQNPVVFIDMVGVRPAKSGALSITLTPRTAAQVGKEMMQLGEFCLKEFKRSTSDHIAAP